MGRLAAIGDKNRAFTGGFFGTACVLIEFTAGNGGDGHGGNPLAGLDVGTLLLFRAEPQG